MKLTEWARMHSTLRLHDEDDEEEDVEAVKRRNKKRKKPTLTKAHTLDSGTNFGSFYMDKGMKIAPLQKKSSSFLSHREKCIERVKLTENKSQSNTGSNQNRFLFQRVSNTKKRKRDNE